MNYSKFKITMILNGRLLRCPSVRLKALEILQQENEFEDVDFTFEETESENICSEYNPIVIRDCSTGKPVSAARHLFSVERLLKKNSDIIRAACECDLAGRNQ